MAFGKWTTYRKAVQWIAVNDNDGSDGRLDVDEVEGYVSTLLVADLFDQSAHAVARAVVRERKTNDLLERAKD